MQIQESARIDPVSVLQPPGRLHFLLFGGFELLQSGLPLRRTRSRTEKWLLALLLLRANREVERSWLAGTFWPDTTQEQALNNLRRSLSNLRQVLGSEAYRLVSPTPHTLAFDLADAFCDVTAFDAHIARGDAASLRQAVALYRGPLLPGCEADWALPERASREQSCLAALETLAAQAMQDGDAQEATLLLRQALRTDAFRETAHRALMQALALLGDRAGVTLAYRQCRLLLHEALQTEPSPETRALYQRLQEEGRHKQGIASASNTAAASREDSTRAFPLHIPWPVSELVGRQEESREVALLLSHSRLVTLTGTGGVGKTRLALDVAINVATCYRDGVWFVDLASVTEEDSVTSAIATALKLPEEAGQSRLETLCRFVADKELLLLPDNCEHLLNACASGVTALLRCSPGLRVLATSRQALGVTGERAWRVPSLALPEQVDGAGEETPDALLAWPATRLFLERALEASTAFTLTAQNARFVTDICRRLDGIPLAIEMAAARVKALSPEQIATRLEDAFRLLTGGSRAALPRQQTLRALLDWSYALLPPQEQRFLCALSVFAGGWPLEAAEAVMREGAYDQTGGNTIAHGNAAPDQAADVLDLLESLVDKSLVVMQVSADGSARYRLLEMVRQYAQRHLQESGAQARVSHSHADYFLHFAEEAGEHLTGPNQADWLNKLQAEYDNVRAALRYYAANVQPGDESGLRLAGALARFWQIRGYMREGSEWLARMLTAYNHETGTLMRCRALNGAGTLAYNRGDFNTAADFYQQSLIIYKHHNHTTNVGHMLINLGNVAYRQGDNGTARSRYSDGLALFRETGHVWGIASALGSLGNVEDEEGNYAAARNFQEESLAVSRSLGDDRMTAYTLHNLANLAVREGNAGRALPLYQESLAMKRALGDRRGIASSLNSLGFLAAEAGDYDHAGQCFREAITLAQEIEDKVGIVTALMGLAWQAATREEPLRAARFWGAAERGRELLKMVFLQQDRDLQDGLAEAARQKTQGTAFADAWNEGRALRLEQAVQEALK